MDPKLLIIETSGRAGFAALAHGNAVLEVCRLDEMRRHARDLAPAVAELLARQQWKPRDIDGVIVSRGPGSYTGLRVGIMSAKAFAYATHRPLIAVESFAAIALQAPMQVVDLDVLADAQQGRVYVQSFNRPESGDTLVPASSLAIRNFSDYLASLDGQMWLSGPGLHLYRKRLSSETLVVTAETWEPQPESLLQLGLARFGTGQADDLWNVEPLYLRPSSAEENWRKNCPPGS